MALIKCQECGKEISDKAEACPHCGCPVSNMKTADGEPQNEAKEETAEPAGESKSEVENSTPKASKSKKTIGIICGIIVILIVACVGVYFGTAKSRNYSAAVKDYEAKAYEKAMTEFESLGDYKDSPDLLNKTTYAYAQILFDEEKYEEAKGYFADMEGYEDAAERVSECEYLMTVDGQFMKALSKGLMKRWDKGDEYEEQGKTGEDPVIYNEYCDIELAEIEPYYEKTFGDAQLGEDAKKYIDLVKMAKEAIAYYSIDYITYLEQWQDTYEKRIVAIQKFVDTYHLALDSKYDDTVKKLLADASASVEHSQVKEAIQEMAKEFQLSYTEDEWGLKTYKLHMKNSTDRVFDYFNVDISILDGTGKIIGNGWGGQVSSWQPGQEAEVDAYIPDDISIDENEIQYILHYQSGSLYE